MYDTLNVPNYPTTTHTSVSVGGSGGGGRGVVPELLDAWVLFFPRLGLVFTVQWKNKEGCHK